MPVGAVPFPFGVCRICKDKATGLHYGVATCEGCKGFFKRSISKGESFKCIYSDNCDVTPLTRSRCKACRFKRCMETGMSVDGVRMGRIPKTEKNKVLDMFRRGGSDFNKHELIVNPTGSGNFDFNLKTTTVTTNTNLTMPTMLNSKHTVSDTSSDSDTNLTPLKQCDSLCTFGAGSNERYALQATTSDNNDPFSSFLSQVGLSLQQNLFIPNTDDHTVYGDNNPRRNVVNTSVQNGRQPSGHGSLSQNNCSTVPIFSTNQKQALLHHSDNADMSLGSNPAVTSAICENPFSDVYSINNSLPATSFMKQGIANPKQRFSLLQDGRQSLASHTNFIAPARTSDLMSSLEAPSSSLSLVNAAMLCRESASAAATGAMDCTASASHGNVPLTSASHGNVQLTSASHGNAQLDDSDTALATAGNTKPVHGISRGLVNVLIEEVLNSKGGVQIICEKIEQMSKRRKVETCACNEDSCSGLHDMNTDTVYKNENTVLSAETGASVLCTDDTSQQQQHILVNIQGISQGMQALFMNYQAQREKIHQYRLGLIDLRIMTEDDVDETYKKVIDSIPDVNERIIGFCNCVPGINGINTSDRAALIKRAYYDIWMLSSAEWFNGLESMMLMKTGEVYSASVMRKILNDEMVDIILKFANQFNTLRLTDLEKAILCAVRLSAPESLELEDRATVDRFHSDMLDTFAYQIKKNHEQNHARLLIDIFCLMPLLETVNNIQKNIIAKYSLDGPNNSSQ